MENFTTHLSVFAQNINTRAPLAHLPIYAEVGMRAVVENAPAVPADDVTDEITELIRGTLSRLDELCSAQEDCQQRTVKTIKLGLSYLLEPEAQDRLLEDMGYTRSFFERVIEHAKEANGGRSLAELNEARLQRFIFDGIRAEAHERGLQLVPGTESVLMQWAHPMGVLATDHAGYLSFDLRRLPANVREGISEAMKTRKQDVLADLDTTVWLYPLAGNIAPLDALAYARFAHDAIVVRLEMQPLDLPAVIQNAGILAMQNPDLTDWRISPASFATNPGSLVGADGCETLLPANVALQEFHFYQVVRLTNVVPPGVPADLQQQVKLGLVHDYRMTWFPLGHSLGQIQYSLPLAPGESVNLAVIDWTRRDETTRAEDTKLNEQLVHDQRRDRTITETVKAALSEYQEGSSFMAGAALSAGLSAALSKSVGLAAGLTGALGGSSSDTSGSRDLAANTVQQLSENISQASAAMRELQSTVVVRSAQSEQETIETRTVVNYNHSHTLTILYYEVLRHFRIVTELAARRPAVMVKMKADWFAGTDAEVEKIVLRNRPALQASLLDSGYEEAFDALARKMRRPVPPTTPPSSPASIELRYFTFYMTVGGRHADPNEWHDSGGKQDIDIRASLFSANPIKLVNQAGGPSEILDAPGQFTEKDTVQIFVAMPQGVPSVAWNTIDGIGISIGLQRTGVSFARIKIVARDTSGQEHILVDQDYGNGHLVILDSTAITLPLNRPPAPPPAPARSAEEVEDETKARELLDHLKYHASHYSRAILLQQDAAERARLLDEIKFPDGTSVLDHVENRPLEVLGDFVAYPTADPIWRAEIMEALQRTEQSDVPADERLATLPTRGVFAEAQLGNCNVSEEIDNTRFWDWQQSPIPHLAPEIAPINAVSPQPQQQNVEPTPFPQSLVNIVNPPAAPDPTGLAAALNVLGTPNIFRDMSGRAEVSDLLKRLSDNTIGIAEAANRAREIQAKYGNPAASSGTGNSGNGGFGSRAAPTQPSAVNRDLHDLQPVLERAIQKQLITPERAQELFTDAAQNAGSPHLQLAVAISDPSEWRDLARKLTPFAQWSREQKLRAVDDRIGASTRLFINGDYSQELEDKETLQLLESYKNDMRDFSSRIAKVVLAVSPYGGSATGQSVTLEASVFLPAISVPTGDVVFKVTTTGGQRNVLGRKALVNGKASISTTILPKGMNRLTAEFPDQNMTGVGDVIGNSDELPYEVT